MLLQGKKLLITGVLTPHSIAFAVAALAQKQGAEVLLTSFGRPMSLTQRTAKKLDPVPDVLELDVSNSAHFAALHDTIKQRWGRLDGVLHAIGFAPEDALGGKFMSTPWESVAQAFRISTFSLKELAVATRKDFSAAGLSDEQLERIKLEDAVGLHEQVKTDLRIYASQHDQPVVKPPSIRPGENFRQPTP